MWIGILTASRFTLLWQLLPFLFAAEAKDTGSYKQTSVCYPWVTWCFTPSQPVRLYQGEMLSTNKHVIMCYMHEVESVMTEENMSAHKWEEEEKSLLITSAA